MTSLLLVVFFATLISALCSMTEAMLYSISTTHIEKMTKDKIPSAALLKHMKEHIDRPITTVLTLNTIVNTAGSAVAGAIAVNVLGQSSLAIFTVIFTILILICGEILPKTFGVAYNKSLATLLVYPLHYLNRVFTPFIYFSSFITSKIAPKNAEPEATDEDITAMASLSRKSGEINQFEESAINNILSLDKRRVSDIMTPRTVVFSLPITQKIADVLKNPAIWNFSRIPVYKENNEDIVGMVLRKNIAQNMAGDKQSETLESLVTPVKFVNESVTLDKLLTQFLESRQHLFVVLDEYGGLAGVVSLEDVLEEMLGREIVDETDAVADMREVAKVLNKNRMD